jgi:hypothetical protein
VVVTYFYKPYSILRMFVETSLNYILKNMNQILKYNKIKSYRPKSSNFFSLTSDRL